MAQHSLAVTSPDGAIEVLSGIAKRGSYLLSDADLFASHTERLK
jgi:hypothetical protein